MAKRKPKSNAERQKAWRDRNRRPPLGYCTICGKPIWAVISARAGVHQKCCPSKYMAAYREMKIGSQRQG